MKRGGFTAVAILFAAVTIACNDMQEPKHKPKRGQAFDGNENVLVIAPKELLDATVSLDGAQVGYLWSIKHLQFSGVDHHYQPSIPAGTPQDATVTRLYVSEGTHTLTIESSRYAPIAREIKQSSQRPIRLIIDAIELQRRPMTE
ncbi:MAG TPA: hypothetical protein VGQ36_25475 [Thermoanaerobaculia bacterium]|nr:hypothetical protein [Thermoanaerobaculia bacterium]